MSEGKMQTKGARCPAYLVRRLPSGVILTAGTLSKDNIALLVGMSGMFQVSADGVITLWVADKMTLPLRSLKNTAKKYLKNLCNSNTKRKSTVARKSKK